MPSSPDLVSYCANLTASGARKCGVPTTAVFLLLRVFFSLLPPSSSNRRLDMPRSVILMTPVFVTRMLSPESEETRMAKGREKKEKKRTCQAESWREERKVESERVSGRAQTEDDDTQHKRCEAEHTIPTGMTDRTADAHNWTSGELRQGRMRLLRKGGCVASSEPEQSLPSASSYTHTHRGKRKVTIQMPFEQRGWNKAVQKQNLLHLPASFLMVTVHCCFLLWPQAKHPPFRAL